MPGIAQPRMPLELLRGDLLHRVPAELVQIFDVAPADVKTAETVRQSRIQPCLDGAP